MEKIDLKAQPRNNKVADRLRKQGFIPAIVYGHHIDTESLMVSAAEFERVFRKAGESTLINLNFESGKARNVIIHDVQKHYLTGRPQHVDFYEVSMTERMKASVPLELVGVSKAVKENGGTLVQILSEIEVECLPGDLPHTIEVDISSLNSFDDNIHVSDLKVSDKVQILTGAEEVVVKADAPRDIEAELSAPVVEDVSKVEGAAENKPVEQPEEKKEKE